MRQFDAPRHSLGNLDAEAAGSLIAAAADVALIVDEDGIICDLAFGSEEMSKEGYEGWLGQLWTDTVTVESRPKVEALLRDAAANSAPRWRHVNHHTASGTDIPLMYSAVRVAGDGRALAVGRAVAFGRDLRATAALQQRLVEAQQSMERDYWRLRHAETRYRHLFQVAAEAVLVVDSVSRKILEANPAASHLLAEDVRKIVGAQFPIGLDERSAEAVQTMLAGVRAAGRPDVMRSDLAGGRGDVMVAASMFRQENATLFLVRLSRIQSEDIAPAARDTGSMLVKLVQHSPDCIVVTDPSGHIVSANAAFIELAQLTNEDQVRGESLDRWLGRTGVDLSVMLSNLRQSGAVRLFATTLRGEYGSTSDVEVSASFMAYGDDSFLGFTIRDVGRRLLADGRGGRALPRSVGQMTELVGRVPMKDIVGETTDLIEQLCIEAALELTRNNRAAAAEMLGLSRQSLYVKLRRYGLGEPVVES